VNSYHLQIVSLKPKISALVKKTFRRIKFLTFDQVGNPKNSDWKSDFAKFEDLCVAISKSILKKSL